MANSRTTRTMPSKAISQPNTLKPARSKLGGCFLSFLCFSSSLYHAWHNLSPSVSKKKIFYSIFTKNKIDKRSKFGKSSLFNLDQILKFNKVESWNFPNRLYLLVEVC